MKTKLIFALAFSLVIQLINAQSIAKGKNVFYIGAGPGTGYVGSTQNYKGAGYTYNKTPSFQLGFEHGISEAIPKSVIGLGPHFSAWFGSSSYRDKFGYGWNKQWADFSAIAKGFYHHKFLVGEKWDVYGAALLGLRFRSYNFSTNDVYYEYARDSYSTVAPVIGAGIGGRYYVSKAFGFYAEVNGGYNCDYAQIGFAFKF